MLGVGARSARRDGPELDQELAQLLDAVADGATTPDAAAAALGIAATNAAVGLARLELLGYLRADSAGRYERTSMRVPAVTTLGP
jgi:predicted Rossmann fold nucleotide-binding protein DprA/Smf involved in DNA uptake